MQPIIIAGAAALLINGLCILLSAFVVRYYWYPAMFGIASTGTIVFFGIIIQNLQSATEKEISSQSMRLATAGMIASTYLALVVYCLFLQEDFKLSPFSETLVTNFTAVVGTVLVFFFGSSAYIEAKTKTEKESSEKKVE